MRKGFTLAEVLITLGILGVVAAVTMPTLIGNHERKVWAKSLTKAYSTATQACKMALAQNNTSYIQNTDFFIHSSVQHNFISHNIAKKYFKDANIYQTMHKNIPHYTSAKKNSSINDKYIYGLDFPSMTIYMQSGTHTEGYHATYNPYPKTLAIIRFAVDVNGRQKGPNIVGYDYFKFDLGHDCSLNKINMASTSYCVSNSHALQQASGCFNKVMDDGWEIKYNLE